MESCVGQRGLGPPQRAAQSEARQALEAQLLPAPPVVLVYYRPCTALPSQIAAFEAALDITASLIIKLDEKPHQKSGPQGFTCLNQFASADATVLNTELAVLGHYDESRPDDDAFAELIKAELTKAEHDTIVYPAAAIGMVALGQERGPGRTIATTNPLGFALNDIIVCLETVEFVDRGKKEWFGGVDVHRGLRSPRDSQQGGELLRVPGLVRTVTAEVGRLTKHSPSQVSRSAERVSADLLLLTVTRLYFFLLLITSSSKSSPVSLKKYCHLRSPSSSKDSSPNPVFSYSPFTLFPLSHLPSPCTPSLFPAAPLVICGGSLSALS